MAGSSEKTSQTPLLAIIGTLLLGAVATRGGGGNDETKAKPVATTAKAGRDGGSEGSMLAPLEEALLGKRLDRDDKAASRRVADLKSEWEKKFSNRAAPRIECLVALVPDPVDSSVSFRFDETVESIELAAIVQNFVLERWRFPWDEKHAAPKNFVELGIRWGTERTPAEKSGSNPRRPTSGDPGMLVFRKVVSSASDVKDGQTGKPDDDPAARPRDDEFLAVILVPETPTHGVDRPTLVQALELVEAMDETFSSNVAPEPKTLRILGPSYSGSMPSMRDGLLEWLKPCEHSRPRRLDVVSGAAWAFDKKAFLDALSLPSVRVDFAATVHRAETVCAAVLKYLGYEDGDDSIKNDEVVILSELNTGAAQITRRQMIIKSRSSRTISLRYPLHIGEVRRVYESQGLLSDGAAEAIRGSLEIRQQAEDSATVRDIVPDQTPGQTAVSENRTLMQAMQYLQDGRFRTVGIIATDPHDAVFLARLINRYCPDATIFIIGSDLMLLDPESIADMRGVVVGATYPLFPLNHAWTASELSSRGSVFTSQHAQGTYNAAVIHLNRAAKRVRDEDSVVKSNGLIEYSTPRALTAGRSDRLLPPVWISKVGERLLYPVDCIIADVREDYLCPVAARDDSPGTTRCLQIDRVVGWLVALGILSSVVIFYQIHRLHRKAAAEPDREAARVLNEKAADLTTQAEAKKRPHRAEAGPLQEQATALRAKALSLNQKAAELAFQHGRHSGVVNVALMTLFAFAAEPLIFVAIARHHLMQIALVAMVIALFIIVLGFAVENRRSLQSLKPRGVRWPRVQASFETLAIATIVIVITGTVVFRRHDIGLQLQAVRSTSLTSGLSVLIPLWFLFVGVAAWGWASHRLEKIGRLLPAGWEGPSSGIGISRRIQEHRTDFDRLFQPLNVEPQSDRDIPARQHSQDRIARLTGASRSWLLTVWDRHRSRVCLGIVWLGVVIDSLFLRTLTRSGEGWIFDSIFLVTFMGMLLWIGLDAVRLARAWKELKKVLDEYSRVLSAAFSRVPSRVSRWYVNPESARSDYETLILRQVRHAGILMDAGAAGEVADRAIAYPAELRPNVDAIGQCAESSEPDRLERDVRELDAINRLIAFLSPYWNARPAYDLAPKDGKSAGDGAVVSAVEDLLALEAARWIGGALARIWTLVGALVLASLALLLALTSYPFPEQLRGMSLMGLVIAALIVLILRVAIGANRDEALNLLGDHDPGKINWNASFFGNLATYVVPLAGVLAALSFQVTDLFRSVLGPILRLFP